MCVCVSVSNPFVFCNVLLWCVVDVCVCVEPNHQAKPTQVFHMPQVGEFWMVSVDKWDDELHASGDQVEEEFIVYVEEIANAHVAGEMPMFTCQDVEEAADLETIFADRHSFETVLCHVNE